MNEQTESTVLSDALLAYAEWWITPETDGCVEFIGKEQWNAILNHPSIWNDTTIHTNNNEQSSWLCLLLWAMLTAEATEATETSTTQATGATTQQE